MNLSYFLICENRKKCRISLAASWSSSKTCWHRTVETPGDCKCDIHHGWYMWICWKRGGTFPKFNPTHTLFLLFCWVIFWVMDFLGGGPKCGQTSFASSECQLDLNVENCWNGGWCFFPHETSTFPLPGQSALNYRTEEGSFSSVFREACVPLEVWVLYCPWKQRWLPLKMNPKRKMRFLVHIPHFQAVCLVSNFWGVYHEIFCQPCIAGWDSFIALKPRQKNQNSDLELQVVWRVYPSDEVYEHMERIAMLLLLQTKTVGGVQVFGECHCFEKRSCMYIYIYILCSSV